MLKTVRKAFQDRGYQKTTFLYIVNADRCKIWITAPDSGSRSDITFRIYLRASRTVTHTAFLMRSPVARSQGCQSSH